MHGEEAPFQDWGARRVWHDERLTEEARQGEGVQGSGALPRARVVGLVRSGLAGFGG